MNAESAFHSHRPRLLALAYRLLGSRADAEDIVQEAWLRWAGAAHAEIADPLAWLVTATTRLGLDRLRALKRQRTDYIGPWLPEPLDITLELPAAPDPAQVHALAEDVSLAFLALLGAVGAKAGGASVWRGVLRVTFWGAIAMAAAALERRESRGVHSRSDFPAPLEEQRSHIEVRCERAG